MKCYHGKLSISTFVVGKYLGSQKKLYGFTFFELLVSLAIISIFIFFAIPLFKQLIAQSHLELRRGDLLTTLKEAKLAAIRSGERIVICRSSRQEQRCVGKVNIGNQNWSEGWLLFIDINDDKQYQTNEKLIKNNTYTTPYCDVDWNRGDYLSYFKFGTLQGAAKAGTFTISCGQLKSKVILNWIGRIRVEIVD